MTENCFIMGAGPFDGFVIAPEPDDFLIAADGGYRILQNLDREPNILLGDFDSLTEIPSQVPGSLEILRYSPMKDETDMALAVACAGGKGYRRFFMYGGLGGRLDHTIANLQLLTGMSQKGLEGYLIGQGCIVTALTDGGLLFPEEAKGFISVFCSGKPAVGVTESGLKYTLEDAVLTSDRAVGVSNEFTGMPASITVKNGTLLILWEDTIGLPSERWEESLL